MALRTVTLPEPRCPLCFCVMEEVQIKIEEDPFNQFRVIPHEVWGCSSCHTNHVFPARREFLEFLGLSKMLETNNRVIHLPK